MEDGICERPGARAITAKHVLLLMTIMVLLLVASAQAAQAHDHFICTRGGAVLLVDPHDGTDPSGGAALRGNPHIPDDGEAGGIYRGLHPVHWFIHKGPSGNDKVGNNPVVVSTSPCP